MYHLKIDPVKNQVNTENIKTEENVKTNQDYRGEEDAQKFFKSVTFEKQENRVKQDHHEEIDKNVIRALKNWICHIIFLLLTKSITSSTIGH